MRYVNVTFDSRSAGEETRLLPVSRNRDRNPERGMQQQRIPCKHRQKPLDGNII